MKSKFLLLTLLSLLVGPNLYAQSPDVTPWLDDPYGNQWINYNKNYARVGIPEDGVYRVNFSALQSRVPGISSGNFEIWHRGRKIEPLEVTAEYVVFWGRRNDGSSDEFLFLSPQDRTDKTTSFFSEEGSYFFTTGTPSAPASINGALQGGTPSEPYHTETLIVNHSRFDDNGQRRFISGAVPAEKYRYIDFAFNAYDNQSVINPTNYSLYDKYNAYVTGIGSPGNSRPAQLKERFSLVNRATDGPNPILEYAIHGLSYSMDHRGLVHVGPSEATLMNNEYLLMDTVFYDYATFVKVRQLNPGANFDEATGNGFISFKTFYETGGDRLRDRWGISYYKITYPQQLIYNGSGHKKFYFKSTGAAGRRRISISNAPANPLLFDLSDSFHPRRITNYELTAGQLTFEIDRGADQDLVILVGDAGNPQSVQHIYDVDFAPIDYHTTASAFIEGYKLNPNAFDLLMVTHDNPAKPVLAGAQEYFNYRTSPEGGNHRTLLITMRNLYDQFNFGEPSPLAIRRFVDYMLSGTPKVRPEHALFLLGHAVTYPIRVKKELPYEVPSIGDPGSDALLASYLTNSPHADPNIPAIPVARITAFKSEQIIAYLNKVKKYEEDSKVASPSALGWRRKGLHMVGAKVHNPNPPNPSEIREFRGYFDLAVQQMVNNSPGFPWQIVTKDNIGSFPAGVTQTGNRYSAVEEIKPDVQGGLGFLSYFGHGNVLGPIYNFEQSTKYSFLPGQYPFMYVTGCGIGNFYTSDGNLTIANTWIVEPNRGAIAMISNTFDAYPSTASDYMTMIYAQIFGKSEAERGTIGQIWRQTAENYLSTKGSARMAVYNDKELSHIHQTVLMGDPMLKILVINEAILPVELSDFRGSLYENSSVLLEWTTRSEKNNSHFEIERSLDGKVFRSIGRVEGQGEGDEVQHYSFIDRNPVAGLNYYRLKQVDKGEAGFDLSNVISVRVEGSLDVYPNPTSDRVKIKSLDENKSYDWTVISISGNRVRTGHGSEISLENLPAGVYMIELKEDQGILLRKRVIKH